MIRDLLSTGLGKAAIILLILQVGLAVYALTALDYVKLSAMYMNPNLWVGKYPPHAPPCWAVKRHSGKIDVIVNTSMVKPAQSTVIPVQAGLKFYNVTWVSVFRYRGDAPPSDTLILLKVFVPKNVLTARLTVLLMRPDNLVLPLVKDALIQPGSQNVVLGVGNNTPLMLSSVTSDSPLYSLLVNAFRARYGANATSKLFKLYNVGQVLWLKPPQTVLKGPYKIYITLLIVGKEGGASRSWVYLMLRTLPNCYGWMGTDSYGRPIALGILLGYPWAFVISFYVTILSVLIGGLYGIVAGLASGWKAELLMRIVDIVYSIPLLPFLIAVIIATNSRSIWMILTIMVALLWTGPVIVVRSMTLQIKEQPYIESARAIGASQLRIIFRYILPQILPYLVTLMVLGIPDPILTEAALAFLGLSDPTIPTWGKMLENAWNEHAVVNGWWWSFLFPGLALAFYCAAFLMLGRALEPIVSPRLRR